jgi:glycosyltransferase involved in cell wall biosynthesis
VSRILFYDSGCPAPYSSESLRIPGTRIGGAEATVVRVAESLSERHLVSVGQHNRTRAERSAGGDLQWLPRTEALDSSLRPDAVVVLRRVGDLPLMRRHHRHARLFVWSHDWFDPRPPGLSRASATWRAKLELRFWLHARYGAPLVGVSRTHMENIRDRLNETRVIGPLRDRVRLDYVYNPIPQDLDVSPDGTEYDPTKLFFFSAAWKGLDVVLRTFHAVRPHFPDLRLHIASPGYHPIDARDDPSNASVVYLGSLSHEAVLREVRTALCVFYPADRVPETFGLVFAESNAVGTPVLAHPFGAAPELLTPEQLVDARDIAAIIERLRAWRNGGRPTVRARSAYRLSAVAREWERILFS